MMESRLLEKITEIVLTGGPCSGKTTGLGYLQEKLQDRGFRVFINPEVATMFIGGGIPDINDIAKTNPVKYVEIEKQMLLTQLALRRSFGALAELFPNEKRVIIHDRGMMDVAAYIPRDYFSSILKENGLDLKDVRDGYDAVFHLVTAANGAERFYTNKNNPARRENLMEAREADDLTLQAWIGHNHLRIINNSTDFETKMKRLLQSVSRALGIPVPLEIERKFLLKQKPVFPTEILNYAQEILIEQIYLTTPDNREIRIRKRSQNGSSVYYKTQKIDVGIGVRQETENFISSRDYLDLQKLQDPDSQTIKKLRFCFVYKDQYFELDSFVKPVTGLYLLEIELTEVNDRLELPPFLEIAGEITGDRRYTNFAISRKDWVRPPA